jgi:CheY-like chemotaxis protein
LKPAPLILLVDDSVDSRSLYSEYLDLVGFRVEEASDGLEAIEKALASPPDLIVMDLTLPRMGGREATQKLKADERTKDIPVVVLSGHTPADQDEPWDRYLVKPCLPDDLVAAIRQLLPSSPEPS